ncbi:zinc finger, CCHC-type containing protein [Tanacetum coccineum]
MAGNTVKEVTTNFGKLDKFERHDFRRWQKKMHFLLMTLKVVYVLTTPMPELMEDDTVEAIRRRENIIDKLPPSWKDYKHTLKHGKDDLSLVQLGSHLRIEESLRAHDSDKGKGKEVGGPSVNMTEEGKNKHNKQNKGKKRSNENNSGSSSNKKPKLECWKCGKTGHFKRDCRSGKKNNANAGGSGKGSKDQSQDQGQNLVNIWNSFVKYSVSLISEAFYVQVDAIAWWIDSGATTHVCKDRCWFKTFEPVEDGSVLYMGDEHFAPIHGKGSVALEFSSGKIVTLFNVLYVPKLRKNLVSGPVLNKCGYKQVYESDKYILSKCGVFVGFGYYNNGMFMLNLNKVPDDSDSVYMSSSTVVNSTLWHARLGHVHYKRMLEMSKDDLIPAIDENLEKCTTCMLTKITRQPFKSITRKSVILELIHSDLCDFHATPSLGNKKYVITFIDDASRFCYVYLLHAKDEALDKFRIYKTEVELQQNDLVKTLRTDRGGEYYDPVFFQSVGIIHETTAPYTPQQNGVAERKNRALKEMVNSMLSYLGLSEGFWGEAMAVVRLPDPKRKTFGEKGIDCIFIGYAEHSKAYMFYVIEPNDSMSINSIIESRDAIFEENRVSSIPRPKDIILNMVESQRDYHSDDVPSEIPEPRKGKRVRKAKSYGSDFQLYLVEGSRDQKETIDDDIGSIMENTTWVLSDIPPGCKPLGCKWIFKRKMKVDGTIDKFKAGLVIQGFRQKEGIDYFDTYAPISHEEVFMKQPEGFVMPGNEHKVCKLVKSLYGLKQVPKQWHQKFDEVVLSSGFHLNQSDKCAYSKFDSSDKGVIICLYVDDMLIFGTDQNQVDKTKKFLSSRFSMKDMGEADVILGFKIKRNNKGIVITQSHYIEKILKKFNREDCSPVSTPMDLVEKLKTNTGKPVDQLEYSRAIGCLMYAMTSTRPDIAYAVDSSSTSGWVFLLGGGAISWASKKKTCITSSTIESEFVALAVAGKEA